MSNTSKYAFTFIAGVVIGAVIVSLLNKENRDKLEDMLHDKADSLRDILEAELERMNTIENNDKQFENE